MKQAEHTATKGADVTSLLNPCLHFLCSSPGRKESLLSSVSQICFDLHFNWYGFLWNGEDSTKVIQGDRKDTWPQQHEGKIQLFSEQWGWLSHINSTQRKESESPWLLEHWDCFSLTLNIYKCIFGRAGIFPINCVWKGLVYLYRHPLDYITTP